MIRVAFGLNGSEDQRGDGCYNYVVNLVTALCKYVPDRVQPVLFAGVDSVPVNLAPFAAVPQVEIVRSVELNASEKTRRLRDAILTGCDRRALGLFRQSGIDVIFETAQFYGWRIPIPVIGWIPDFQHRRLRDMFTFRQYWKREIGFRMQVLAQRTIMLSSEDSRRDCQAFYPGSIGRNAVVHFSVQLPAAESLESTLRIQDIYNLPDVYFYLPNQFWKHKNHSVVIEALRILRGRGVEVVVAASGRPEDQRDPAFYPGLQKRVAEYGLTDNFRFLGLIPRQHVFALLRSSRALLNPSLCEGWSTTVEEAKALAIPMILSDLPVLREQAGNAARYFNSASPEQLAGLLEDSLQRESLRAGSYEVLWKKSAQRVKEFASDFAALAEKGRSDLLITAGRCSQ